MWAHESPWIRALEGGGGERERRLRGGRTHTSTEGKNTRQVSSSFLLVFVRNEFVCLHSS